MSEKSNGDKIDPAGEITNLVELENNSNHKEEALHDNVQSDAQSKVVLVN